MRVRVTVRFVVAVLLLAVVLVTCISPAVDLPESALRSKQAAMRIAMAIVALATALAGLLLPLVLLQSLPLERSELPPDPSFSDAVLPLLC